jgi:hypothetical protein
MIVGIIIFLGLVAIAIFAACVAASDADDQMDRNDIYNNSGDQNG